MKVENMIKANELPIKQLNQLGLNEKMILSLDPKEIDKMMKGRLSPLIANLTLKNVKNGKDVQFPGKIRFLRAENGEVQLLAYPVNKELKNEYGLTKQDYEKLKNGEVILTTYNDKDGVKNVYLQADRETNTIMAMKEKELRVPNAIGDVLLGEDQKEQFRKGLPIEIERGDTKITVGVDLDDPSGCKVINGDMNEWKRQKEEKIALERKPDENGLWKETKKGLVYVSIEQEQAQKNFFGLKR